MHVIHMLSCEGYVLDLQLLGYVGAVQADNTACLPVSSMYQNICPVSGTVLNGCSAAYVVNGCIQRGIRIAHCMADGGSEEG